MTTSTTTIKTRFYDNDRGTIHKVPLYSKRHIETILADDRLPNPLLKNSDIRFYSPSLFSSRVPLKRYMNRYAEAFPGNAFVNKVIDLDKFFDKEMPCGMTIPQIIDLMLWCIQVTGSGEEVYVFLDWDRTLSCVEGLYHKTVFKKLKVSYTSYLEYIMGGPPRFQLVKLLFRVFRAMGVRYFILTNNGMAAHGEEGDRNFFHKLIQILDPTFVIKRLLYTGSLQNKAMFFGKNWARLLSQVPIPDPLTIDELILLRDEICRYILDDLSDQQQQQQHQQIQDILSTVPLVGFPGIINFGFA
uniref:Uncharacterized protein n=1 Tax=viral metagenome TaxID=1070528 RepID=A0A6C0K686_9ZZZZ